MERKILEYLELSGLVVMACIYCQITSEEAGLYHAEIARDIAALVGGGKL